MNGIHKNWKQYALGARSGELPFVGKISQNLQASQFANHLKFCVQHCAESEGPWGRAEAHEHRMWKRQSALKVYTMSLP